jgi:peptide/nickel transport system permease protein
MVLAFSVVFATMVVSFFLFFAGPGDPALNICGDTKCSTQRVEDIRKSFHLDEPVTKQFADYAVGVVADARSPAVASPSTVRRPVWATPSRPTSRLPAS